MPIDCKIKIKQNEFCYLVRIFNQLVMQNKLTKILFKYLHITSQKYLDQIKITSIQLITFEIKISKY